MSGSEYLWLKQCHVLTDRLPFQGSQAAALVLNPDLLLLSSFIGTWPPPLSTTARLSSNDRKHLPHKARGIDHLALRGNTLLGPGLVHKAGSTSSER